MQYLQMRDVLLRGIDIPVIDMVAFMDPRESTVDIVQAIGRAMRKPRGQTTKERGYVLVPLFAGLDGSSLEETIENEGNLMQLQRF